MVVHRWYPEVPWGYLGVPMGYPGGTQGNTLPPKDVFFFLHWCFYPHWLKDCFCLVCRISIYKLCFILLDLKKKVNVKNISGCSKDFPEILDTFWKSKGSKTNLNTSKQKLFTKPKMFPACSTSSFQIIGPLGRCFLKVEMPVCLCVRLSVDFWGTV